MKKPDRQQDVLLRVLGEMDTPSGLDLCSSSFSSAFTLVAKLGENYAHFEFMQDLQECLLRIKCDCPVLIPGDILQLIQPPGISPSWDQGPLSPGSLAGASVFIFENGHWAGIVFAFSLILVLL